MKKFNVLFSFGLTLIFLPLTVILFGYIWYNVTHRSNDDLTEVNYINDTIKVHVFDTIRIKVYEKIPKIDKSEVLGDTLQ